ncbi:hypothetical protein HA466_0268650 [Hirschfeldia incana]|nr:hypothetical protein HA466_0268630 [Hirschfeldia incana]KAJ0235276.1 hypothetical protein HA466_0268650 [Hirschfeldia incana]
MNLRQMRSEMGIPEIPFPEVISRPRYEMAFYGHYPYCKRLLFTFDYASNNQHDTRCEDCGQRFCSLCTHNVHFPATCNERANWEARPYLGPEHFTAFNAAVDAWERFDEKLLALTAKKKSLQDDFRLPFWAIFDELEHVLRLLRWTAVIAWHAPKYASFRYCAITNLEESFDSLLASISEEHVADIHEQHYSVQEQRKKASTAAIEVLSIIARYRKKKKSGGDRFSVSHEIDLWKSRPKRGSRPA